MFPNTCPFCDHGNPADAKFCSACGGALHLVPCPRCGAVSDVTATTCYQCHSQLPGRGTDALEPALPAAEASGPLPRRHARLMVGTAVVAAIAVLGYYGYRQRSLVEAPHPPATGSEASRPGAISGAGVIRRDAAAGDTKSAKADDSAPTSPATSSPKTPLAGPTRAAGNQPRAGRQPVESREAKADAAPTARSQAINVGRVSERGPSRPVACTESVAALGLCPPESSQKKEAETAAATRSMARPQANAAGKTGGQEPPRQEACTEAVAALGLCTPGPTQRRE
jgi:ribosomal protein L40E